MTETNIFGINVPDYKDSADGIVFSNIVRKLEELITKRVIYMNCVYEFLENINEIRLTLNYLDNPAKIVNEGQMFIFRCEGNIDKVTKIRIGSSDFKEFAQKRNYANGEYIQVLYENGVLKDVSQVRDIATGNGLKDVDLSSKDYTIELGTPSTITKATTNISIGETHNHALNLSSYTFNAGQGMNGSGNLQDNVITFNLGTPSKISKQSKNSVGGDTHSHEMDLSQYVVNFGAGLTGNGNLQSGMNISLGTPSTLDCSTENSSQGLTHTHKLERATQQDIVQATNETKVMTPKDVKESINEHSFSFPVGGIMYWASDILPNNFMICDGTFLSKTTYTELFSVLSDRYGESGNNFRLPNITDGERFIRSVVVSNLGRIQDDAMRNITGRVDVGATWNGGRSPSPADSVLYKSYFRGLSERGGNQECTRIHIDVSRQVPTADEFRPTNIGLIPIIRVK